MPKKKIFVDDPFWTYETVLKPDGFDMYNKYYYKRNKAKRIVLDTPISKAYSGYKLIEKDLRNCLIWLRIIEKHLNEEPRYSNQSQNLDNTDNRELFDMIKGLFVASLTIYGKCFTTCEGRRIKLERDNLDESHKDTHDYAMSFRHNFAAHSGAKNMEFARFVVVLEPKKYKSKRPVTVAELLQPDTWGLENVKEFIGLAESARIFALEKVEMLHEKLDEYVLKKGKDYWYAL